MKPLSGALIDYRQKDTLQGQTTYQKISKIEQWVKKSEKVDICLPFLGKKKKLCPCALTLKRQMHQKGQSFINFFQKSSRHTISKGTRIFPKRQKRYQKWSRGARSTPFRSLQSRFRESPVYYVRRNKKILRYFLEFPATAGRGAAWKRLRKKQEAGPGAVRRRGLRF